jgi:hypothetical protein
MQMLVFPAFAAYKKSEKRCACYSISRGGPSHCSQKKETSQCLLWKIYEILVVLLGIGCDILVIFFLHLSEQYGSIVIVRMV